MGYDCNCVTAMHECFDHIPTKDPMEVVNFGPGFIDVRLRDGSRWRFNDLVLVSSTTTFDAGDATVVEHIPITFGKPFRVALDQSVEGLEEITDEEMLGKRHG